MNIEYWKIHALLMFIGTSILIYVSLLPTFFRNKKNWFRTHKGLGVFCGITAILGLIVAIYMVNITTGIHFRVLHSYFGIFTIVGILLDIELGYITISRKIRTLRSIHIWLGRISSLLLIITIIMGLSIVF